MVVGFNTRFNIKQTEMIAVLFNEFRVFQPEIDGNTVAALFGGRLKSPLVVRNARTLGFIMDRLSQRLMITNIWQTVAEKNRCFISARGKPISRNTLSSAKYCATRFGNFALNKGLIQEYIIELEKYKHQS